VVKHTKRQGAGASRVHSDTRQRQEWAANAGRSPPPSPNAVRRENKKCYGTQLQANEAKYKARQDPHPTPMEIGTISRKKDPPNCRIQRPKLDRYVQYECCEGTARSEIRKLAAGRPARCSAWENGHLARANGATGGPYCSPALPSVCGRQFEPLAGRGGGFGGRSCTSAAALPSWRLGCFFKSSGEEKRAGPRPSGAPPEDVSGMAALRSLPPGR
jgi:hypothetical protein